MNPKKGVNMTINVMNEAQGGVRLRDRVKSRESPESSGWSWGQGQLQHTWLNSFSKAFTF